MRQLGIFGAVHGFHETVDFSDEAFIAIVESFLPQTNTFIVTNGDIEFTLNERSGITGLLILGEPY